MTARLVLDAARCAGHGICALACPERIGLDGWGYAKVDPTPVSGRRALARARRAVAACPEHALVLDDHAEPQPRPATRARG